MIRQTSADWTPKQARAAALLAAGTSVRETAAALGAGERTVHTWLRDDSFCALVAELRDRMLSEAIGKLSGAAAAAVDRFRGLLDDEAAAIRLRAATAVLDSMVRVREFGELAARVAEMERLMAEDEGSHYR